MLNNQYLGSIIILLGVLCLIIITFIVYTIYLKSNKSNKYDFDLREYTLYLKYNMRTKKVTIENYEQVDIVTAKAIHDFAMGETFHDDLVIAKKSDDNSFNYVLKLEGYEKQFTFIYKEMIGSNAIIKCDILNQEKKDDMYLKTLDDLRIEHSLSKNKGGAFYYVNIKDFNSLNQRYGRRYGDYILEIIRSRLNNIRKYKCSSAYVGSAQYAVYVNKKISKKAAIKFAKEIVKVLTYPIEEKYLMLDVAVGIGICIGAYDDFDEFVKYAYVAGDYAKNRLNYNIILYTDLMKSEENLVISCQREVEKIVNSGKVELNYAPVYNPKRNKYVGYISMPIFSNLFVTLDKVKQAATQLDKVNELMYNIYKKQLVAFIKRRPNKQSKLVIFARLEDLASFMEVYFSERSFQECKIILCLDVKKGYEMINKFSNISNNINRLLNEGVELACMINPSNMYDYDYILRISHYLILDKSVISVSKNNLIENKLLNMIELANTYDLDLFAINVDEYLEFECLLKYKVEYISGEYFGANTASPTEIEYTRTRLLSKIIKDSMKTKK